MTIQLMYPAKHSLMILKAYIRTLTEKITNFSIIILEFAYAHEDIYFEAGMIVGFQLYKELTKV